MTIPTTRQLTKTVIHYYFKVLITFGLMGAFIAWVFDIGYNNEVFNKTLVLIMVIVIFILTYRKEFRTKTEYSDLKKYGL
jgi:uncharacterized membrane protein YfcA